MRELELSKGEYFRYFTGSMHRPYVWAAVDDTASLNEDGRFCRVEVADALAVRFQDLTDPDYAKASSMVQSILGRELRAMTKVCMIAEVGQSYENGSMEYRTRETPAWDFARFAISMLNREFPEAGD